MSLSSNLCILALLLLVHCAVSQDPREGLEQSDVGIYLLTDETFERATSGDLPVLVNFCTSAAQTCQDFTDTWDKVGTLLNGIIPVVTVDCLESPATCNEHAPPHEGYPNIQRFAGVNHRIIDMYSGELNANTIVRFAVDGLLDLYSKLTTVTDAFMDELYFPGISHIPKIIVFSTKDEPSPLLKSLALANNHRSLFLFVGKDSKEVQDHFGVTHLPSVVHLTLDEDKERTHQVYPITEGKNQLVSKVNEIVATVTAPSQHHTLLTVTVEADPAHQRLVSPYKLAQIGMSYKRVFDDELEPKFAIESIYKNNEMKYQDELDFSETAQGDNYENFLLSYSAEHFSDYGEFLIVLEGEGWIDLRDPDDLWVRTFLKPGFAISLPLGGYHRIISDKNSPLKMNRQSRSEEEPEHIERSEEPEQQEHRARQRYSGWLENRLKDLHVEQPLGAQKRAPHRTYGKDPTKAKQGETEL
eukprot:TRINITY_DN1644_c0_g1_i1.p1 TRINITY_DN1644_c0_g1~~TRINITY_DN1644_c0_g1_i1.p1  ORF type:complete len:471 (-),score=134.44 TRINITY_DN1644_c0_g1_i1:187-1599(-)